MACLRPSFADELQPRLGPIAAGGMGFAAPRLEGIGPSRSRSEVALVGGCVQRPLRVVKMYRPRAQRSARPASTSELTSSYEEITPTAIVAMPTSLRMGSANRVWYERPNAGCSSADT